MRKQLIGSLFAFAMAGQLWGQRNFWFDRVIFYCL